MLDEIQTDDAAQDLRLLQDSVRTLLDRAGGIDRARGLRGSVGGWDNAIMREIADAGVLGVMAPETGGGLGMGLRAAGVIATEAGRALAPEPVVPVMALAIGMLHRLCPDDAGLASAISGDTVAALAWQERGPRGLANDISCHFDGTTLNGSKSWVAGAAGAAQILVVATSDNGPVLIRVARDTKGMTLTPRRQSDGSDLYDISFAGASGEVLAQGPQVDTALEAAVADATALAAAELIGVAGRAFEITLEYLKTREQFGKTIGSFQAIQHRAVDMNLELEVASAAVTEALARMETAPDAATRNQQASRAKARASSAAKKITRESIQMHGAVGYTDEFDIGMYLNRALVLAAWLGDAAAHRSRWMDLRETGEAAK